LASQFLGVFPTAIEVNPYLADLVAAKLTKYKRPTAVVELFPTLLRTAGRIELCDLSRELPPTFVEPGANGRFVFYRDLFDRIRQLSAAADFVFDPPEARLTRVLLGAVAVEFSNVLVSGKGRRYRRNWQSRRPTTNDVDEALFGLAKKAANEISRFSNRPQTSYDVVCGDARRALADLGEFDLAVFSPPYPNSFDYTDVYNIELWSLGYLTSKADNRSLRERTLTSHVQIKKPYRAAPRGSCTLMAALDELSSKRSELWNRDIPDMVSSYFLEMSEVLALLRSAMVPDAKIYMVVGDSRYCGVIVRTAEIIAELVKNSGLQLVGMEPFRSMRASPQQGGQQLLSETLLVFANRR
jgi:hypothetical protein